MIVGRRFWILIWYGILVLGILGLIASVHWGRRTHWKNVDEVLRAVGTILVSVGMLVLLYPLPWVYTEWLGEGLLGVALVGFVAAFILGRRAERERERSSWAPCSRNRRGFASMRRSRMWAPDDCLAHIPCAAPMCSRTWRPLETSRIVSLSAPTGVPNRP